jgi:hypothetical protein
MVMAGLVAFASPAKAQLCVEEGIDLCGFVWTDTNGDGIQNDDPDSDGGNGDQSGIDGVNVSLLGWDSTTSQWDSVADTLTKDGGYYSFNVPDGGVYKVVVAVPTGTEPTLTGQGIDSSIDSDGVSDTLGSAVEVCLGEALPCVPSQQSDFGFSTTTKVSSPGTGTPGYWKNHTEVWTGVTIGGVDYTADQASALMGKVSKDKTYSLFSQLVAAKLNVAIGNDDSCIAATIATADAWMSLHPVGSGVTASSTAWQQIAQSHKDLDDYNNGRLCAPHRN